MTSRCQSILVICFFASFLSSCRTTESSEAKDFDNVDFMRSGHQPGVKIVNCTDGRVQRIVKVDADRYDITEDRRTIATVSQAGIAANICEPPGGGGGPDDPGNGGNGQTWQTVLSPPVQAGGKFFLVPLYGLGKVSGIEISATGTNMRVEDAFAFPDSGQPITMEEIGNDEYFLEPGQRRGHRFIPNDGRIQALAIRAEANDQEGTLTVKVHYRRPITYPRCDAGMRNEAGGGCYNAAACYLAGGGCYNSSACYMAGGGCYNSSACYVAGGGCYNNSACYAPGGGCYNSSACYVPGGSCRSSSRCYDRNGREVHRSAGKLIVEPGIFKYNSCQFENPADG